MKKFEIFLHNDFLNEKTTNLLIKNYQDLDVNELKIFEIFLSVCYQKFDYRNKESWWYTNREAAIQIPTISASSFLNQNIWHLHVDQNFSIDNSGKYLTEEIYPAKNKTGYNIIYSKEETENLISLTILLFTKHPRGSNEWKIVEKDISRKRKYITTI